MSQNDLIIANQTFPATRADINDALEALATLSSGPTEPPATYPYQLWLDTTTSQLKQRNGANTAWITLARVSGNEFRLLDNTKVDNGSGVQTGLLGGQAQATWNAGSGTIESLLSPAQLLAAVNQYKPNQTQTTWNTGTNTTESVISAAKLKTAIETHAPAVSVPTQSQATWNTGTNTTESTITAAKLKAATLNHLPTQTGSTWNTGTNTTESVISASKLKTAVLTHVPAQDGGTWNTGTNTAESRISAAKLKAAIETHAPTGGGVGSNLVVNGLFNVNQRGAASRTATNAAYNFDRWYWQSPYLYQVVENLNVPSGTYTLTFGGAGVTAAYAISANTTSAIPGFTSISSGGQITVSNPGNLNVWLRFGGTVANLTEVQLVRGSTAGEFQHRSYAEELALCQRYFYIVKNEMAASTPRLRIVGGNYDCQLPVTMRETPVVSADQSIAEFAIATETSLQLRPSGGSTITYRDNLTLTAEL